MDATLDQRWVWLTWSICLWSSALNADGGPTRHHPARLRADTLIGALLLPTALAQVQLTHIHTGETSGHQLVARPAAVATLALTLALVASCWWLSRGHDIQDIDHLASSTTPHSDRDAHPIPVAPGHRHQLTPAQPRETTAGENTFSDPANYPDSSSGSAAYGRNGNDKGEKK